MVHPPHGCFRQALAVRLRRGPLQPRQVDRASARSSRSTTRGSGPRSAAAASSSTTPTSAAYIDALRLARGMTYKAALAGLAHGGGKSRHHPARAALRSRRAVPRVRQASSRTCAATTSPPRTRGTGLEDMEIIRTQTKHVTGIDPSARRLGRSVAVHRARRAPRHRGVREVQARHATRSRACTSRSRASATSATTCARSSTPRARSSPSPTSTSSRASARSASSAPSAVDIDDVAKVECDVFAPCALGAGLNDDTIPHLHAPIVAGAANNQLAEPRHGDDLHARGILYAPDYAINAGGLVNVAQEVKGYDAEGRARAHAEDLRHDLGDLRAQQEAQRADLQGRRHHGRGEAARREAVINVRRLHGALMSGGGRSSAWSSDADVYRLLFEMNPRPMWVFERETRRLLLVNDAVVTLYGWTREELLQMTLLDLRPPDDRPAFEARVDRRQDHDAVRARRAALDEERRDPRGQPRDRELHGRRADVLARRSRRTSPASTRQSAGSSCSSSTRARRSRRAMRDYVVEYVSPAAERLLGYPASEIVGRRPLEHVHPDDASRWAAPEPFETRTHVARVRHRNGTWRWLESTTTNLLREPAVRAYVTNFRDITARVEAEHRMRESQRRLEYLISATSAVTYTATPYGGVGATFISANVTIAARPPPEDFIEDPGFWREHIHPDDLARVEQELRELFVRGEHAVEYRFRHANGSYRHMRDAARVARDETGQPVEIVGYWLDITEQAQAQEALQRSEENFRSLIERSGTAIVVQREGCIVYANPAAAVMFGYAPERDGGPRRRRARASRRPRARSAGACSTPMPTAPRRPASDACCGATAACSRRRRGRAARLRRRARERRVPARRHRAARDVRADGRRRPHADGRHARGRRRARDQQPAGVRRHEPRDPRRASSLPCSPAGRRGFQARAAGLVADASDGVRAGQRDRARPARARAARRRWARAGRRRRGARVVDQDGAQRDPPPRDAWSTSSRRLAPGRARTRRGSARCS